MNLSRHTLWIWVIVAFALLIGAWTFLITIASRNAPDPVPLENAPEAAPGSRP